MKMLRGMFQNRVRCRCICIALVFGSAVLCGCSGDLFYPYLFDVSGFEEFNFRTEDVEACFASHEAVEWFFRNTVCEATISKIGDSEYVVRLGVSADFRVDPESSFLPERPLTESEIQRMLSLFDQLNVDWRPRSDCMLRLLGPQPDPDTPERFYSWDDGEFIVFGCSRERLDWSQAGAILNFLQDVAEAGPARITG